MPFSRAALNVKIEIFNDNVFVQRVKFEFRALIFRGVFYDVGNGVGCL